MTKNGSWTASAVEAPSNATLALYENIPVRPRAIVHINHGMAEHAGRYGRFARALADAGYGAVAQDHRGHGGTIAPQTTQGIFAPEDGLARVLEDVAFVNRRTRDQYPDTPIITFGHSMGSIIAFNHALRKPQSTAALALWNSGVDTGFMFSTFAVLLRLERFFKGSDVPSLLAARLTFDTWNRAFAPNRTAFDWLSCDNAEVDAYVADPLCGFPVSVGLWLDVLSGIRFAASNANLNTLPAGLPVHLVAGSADPYTMKGTAVARIEQRMRKHGKDDVTCYLVDGARHESLNELNRDETTAAFVDWLNKRF